MSNPSENDRESRLSDLRARGSFPLLPEVLEGETTDVYFQRTCRVLTELGRNPEVGMEIFPGGNGVFCGITQVLQILDSVNFGGEIWALEEGEEVSRGEAVIEIFGRYLDFGIFETAILGTLASCTGWATAAREVVTAAAGTPVISFGARHVHPNVAGILDYAAAVGGCVGCSTPLGARLTNTIPSGTMSHAYVLIVGNTVEAAEEFNRVMPPEVPRIVLVDTFQDEAVESVLVAEALGSALEGIRLDTASERGGVTPGLVREVRARLDMAGHSDVQILVSGGVTPERIRRFREAGAPVDGYGVGSHITAASPIDYTGDIREIDGRPVAKLGRIPGLQRGPRLRRLR
jgi:nicotinate phosphoribosyltransferase